MCEECFWLPVIFCSVLFNPDAGYWGEFHLGSFIVVFFSRCSHLTCFTHPWCIHVSIPHSFSTVVWPHASWLTVTPIYYFTFSIDLKPRHRIASWLLRVSEGQNKGIIQAAFSSGAQTPLAVVGLRSLYFFVIYAWRVVLSS